MVLVGLEITRLTRLFQLINNDVRCKERMNVPNSSVQVAKIGILRLIAVELLSRFGILHT